MQQDHNLLDLPNLQNQENSQEASPQKGQLQLDAQQGEQHQGQFLLPQPKTFLLMMTKIQSVSDSIYTMQDFLIISM